jgi:hypothetical protein
MGHPGGKHVQGWTLAGKARWIKRVSAGMPTIVGTWESCAASGDARQNDYMTILCRQGKPLLTSRRQAMTTVPGRVSHWGRTLKGAVRPNMTTRPTESFDIGTLADESDRLTAVNRCAESLDMLFSESCV